MEYYKDDKIVTTMVRYLFDNFASNLVMKFIHILSQYQWPVLLTWFNFNPNVDK